ncbi:MAG: hypothetical protein IJ549_03345 [Prevotella sp.]|nr:hypothetical protein [Prevotella sp.]MBQ9651296.1 hypothetical protein [Prevotella sp.]
MKRLQKFMMALAMTVIAVPAMATSPEVNEVNVASKTQRQVSFPYVGQKDALGAYIVSVTVTNLATMVKVAYHTSKGSVIDTKNILMTDAQTGKKYKYKQKLSAGLSAADRIEYKGWQFVTWVFTKLKDKTTAVNIEMQDGNGFKFYNVDLTQNGTRPKMTQQILTDGLNREMSNDMFHFVNEQQWISGIEDVE